MEQLEHQDNTASIHQLVMACTSGDTERVRELLYEGIPPTEFCLSIPVEHGFTEIVRLVMTYRKPNAGSEICSLIMSAAKHGYTDIVKLLLEERDRIASCIGNEAHFGINKAILGGHRDTISALLSALPDNVPLSGEIVTACKLGHADIVEQLLCKTDVSSIEEVDRKFLYKICQHRGRSDIQEILTRHSL